MNAIREINLNKKKTIELPIILGKGNTDPVISGISTNRTETSNASTENLWIPKKKDPKSSGNTPPQAYKDEVSPEVYLSRMLDFGLLDKTQEPVAENFVKTSQALKIESSIKWVLKGNISPKSLRQIQKMNIKVGGKNKTMTIKQLKEEVRKARKEAQAAGLFFPVSQEKGDDGKSIEYQNFSPERLEIISGDEREKEKLQALITENAKNFQTRQEARKKETEARKTALNKSISKSVRIHSVPGTSNSQEPALEIRFQDNSNQEGKYSLCTSDGTPRLEIIVKKQDGKSVLEFVPTEYSRGFKPGELSGDKSTKLLFDTVVADLARLGVPVRNIQFRNKNKKLISPNSFFGNKILENYHFKITGNKAHRNNSREQALREEVFDGARNSFAEEEWDKNQKKVEDAHKKMGEEPNKTKVAPQQPVEAGTEEVGGITGFLNWLGNNWFSGLLTSGALAGVFWLANKIFFNKNDNQQQDFYAQYQ